MTATTQTNTRRGVFAARGILGPDPVLLMVIAVILAIGIVMVTSAGYIIASGKYDDGFHYTKKQGLAMVMGLGIMYLFSIINPSFWRRMASPLMVIGLALLVLVFVPGLGVKWGGSHRWISLPFGFVLQPSELAKYAMIIFIAHSLAKKGDNVKNFSLGLLPHLLVIGIVVSLVLLQPDFGTAVIITTVGSLMLFVAGVRLQHLLGGAILCLPFLFQIGISAQYRLTRLKTFLDPWADPFNTGFQVVQSLVAFGCGGVWGVGVGKGIQKLFYLPQPHTDFIFSVVGEELGLFGVTLLIFLFYVLICRGLVISIKTKDMFQKLLAFGITSLVGLQAIVNMAVAMGLLPTKGLPLPLVSLGGTSMIVNLAGLGILMAVARSAESSGEEVTR
ncbi:MAG: putative lipid II flippase FtsW [Deltaproteobacteria bacterium]